jgi:hypothetical protein
MFLAAATALALAPGVAAASDQSGGDAGGCPADNSQVASFEFLIRGQTFSTLQGHVHLGDHVTAFFTINPACSGIQVSLASYVAPAPAWDRNTADQQQLYRSATGTFDPGSRQSLSVDVTPTGFYQVDFVRGPVITHFGPASSNNFYGDQNRLIDHDNGPVDTTPVPVGAIGGLGLAGLAGVCLHVASRRPRGKFAR